MDITREPKEENILFGLGRGKEKCNFATVLYESRTNFAGAKIYIFSPKRGISVSSYFSCPGLPPPLISLIHPVPFIYKVGELMNI